MTLPSSGTLSVSQINVELGRSAGASFSMGGSAERTLAGHPSGSYSFSAFYGKSAGGGGGGSPSTAALLGTRSDVTSGGAAVITSLSYGAAAAGRRIFACVEWACSTSDVETLISSFAFTSGSDHRVHIQTGEGGTSDLSNYGCAIVSASVAAGASGTLTLNFNNSTVRTARATTYRVIGLVSNVANDTASAFNEDLVVPSAPSAQSVVNVPSSGLLFVAGVVSSASGLGALAFTGATERVDAAGGVQDRYGSAMSFGLGSQASRPVGVEGSSSVNAARARMVAASFQLA